MASVSSGLALLKRAVGFALVCAGDVTPGKLANPTPCDRWNLRALLAHSSDSAFVLREAIGAGCVSEPAVADAKPGFGPRRCQDPAAVFRAEAGMLLGACAVAGTERQVAVGDRRLAVPVVAAMGAIELAVHGWDISVACGRGKPIPPVLARDLLDVTPLVVTDATRAGLFGDAVRVTPLACPGDKLVAMLGRTPGGLTDSAGTGESAGIRWSIYQELPDRARRHGGER
jgi:uncharacterized protein (TIGR03086 family)